GIEDRELLLDGHGQIRSLFELLAGRPDLLRGGELLRIAHGAEKPSQRGAARAGARPRSPSSSAPRPRVAPPRRGRRGRRARARAVPRAAPPARPRRPRRSSRAAAASPDTPLPGPRPPPRAPSAARPTAGSRRPRPPRRPSRRPRERSTARRTRRRAAAAARGDGAPADP